MGPHGCAKEIVLKSYIYSSPSPLVHRQMNKQREREKKNVGWSGRILHPAKEEILFVRVYAKTEPHINKLIKIIARARFCLRNSFNISLLLVVTGLVPPPSPPSTSSMPTSHIYAPLYAFSHTWECIENQKRAHHIYRTRASGTSEQEYVIKQKNK